MKTKSLFVKKSPACQILIWQRSFGVNTEKRSKSPKHTMVNQTAIIVNAHRRGLVRKSLWQLKLDINDLWRISVFQIYKYHKK